MKKLTDRVTKKHVEEAYLLAEKRGYWSTEVREYYEKFSYSAMQKLDTQVKIKLRENKQLGVDNMYIEDMELHKGNKAIKLMTLKEIKEVLTNRKIGGIVEFLTQEGKEYNIYKATERIYCYGGHYSIGKLMEILRYERIVDYKLMG